MNIPMQKPKRECKKKEARNDRNINTHFRMSCAQLPKREHEESSYLVGVVARQQNLQLGGQPQR